ncbi:rho guanine nucleotide exchange factor 11 isoform X3 [Culicoides brevitarsis]|uniref:rho guanine nucleotide exchange factor 11 isoform X3 n=1 Tax=Culicoides brevitarsis TaxID=469753 RepID=UPI00307CB6E3
MDTTKNAFPERQSSQDSANSNDVVPAVLNGAQLRRPQTLTTSDQHGKVHANTIELTIHKDSSGYGMKVSGDNPVFVESVKPALAAQRAGLMAGDMILRVNGTPVRYSSHVEVVKLIKASEIVHLTIQRSHTHQQQHLLSQTPRPMSTSITNSPSTPVAQRSSITAPLPVDLAKRKEMEFSKMQTLRLMLDEEKKNLEALVLANKNQQSPEIARAQTTIRTLQEQLNQVCGENPQQFQQSRNRRIITSPDHTDSKRLSKEPSTDSSSKHSPGSATTDDRSKIEDTPPGTPPPPYLSQSMTNASSMSGQCITDLGFNSPMSHPSSPTFMNNSTDSNLAQGTQFAQKPNIISMEDDETSDQETYIEEHGPFDSIKQLFDIQNQSYLAVFLNYVLSNSDPSPLLFYLITGLYKEGNVKEMRKWAYEIHSTFLVPRAPLLWPNVDETMAREVDGVLQTDYDKPECLRKIFWKSRIRAKEFIYNQLQEFQAKRVAGLGTMYGPSDTVLSEAKGDKAKEQRIVEETLIPKLQQYLEEVEKEAPHEDPKKIGLCSALSTVLLRMFMTKTNPGSPIDKVTQYVSREKSFKSRIMGKQSRKTNVRGHQLVLHQYHEVTHCNHCQTIIWGVSPQGYQCENCELNIHRACSKMLEETCPGPVSRKTGEGKISKIIEKIRTTHHSSQNDRGRRHEEDGEGGDTFDVDRPPTTCVSIMRNPSDRRSGESVNNVTFAPNTAESRDSMNSSAIGATALFHEEERKHSGRRDSCKSKSAPVSVSRSESYKERSHRKNREKRKTSDPSLGKDIDESVEPQFNSFKSQQKMEGSSNSSLSSTVESPSISCEAITEAPTAPSSSHHSKTSSFSGTSALSKDIVDDELGDDDELETDWSSKISTEILDTMSDVEKKRQEIINEIYMTERNHVRTIKILETMFMRPLQKSNLISADHLNLLFPPSILQLQELHSQFEAKIKLRRQEHEQIVREIGDLLLSLFDGEQGEELRRHAAQFCARQQIALDALRDARKRDDKLHRFLQTHESHKACRRLQLKDLLPTVLQRLTKYPLLFESLLKATSKLTPVNEKEVQAISIALESSKKILNHVNQEVRIAEDRHKLQMIQKRLDRSAYDKLSDKDAPPEFKNIDLTQHKLIHDGPLNMKKNPSMQLYGLLFENMMVLLQKQDEKYILKQHSIPAVVGESKSAEGRFNPITKVSLIFVRQSAVDKNTFFLINTSVSQMLELSAPSSSDCKNWFRHISEASEAYKQRHKGKTDQTDEANLNKSAKEAPEGTPEPDSKSSEDADGIEQTGRLDDKTEYEANLENNNVPQSDSTNSCSTTSNGVADGESTSDSNDDTKQNHPSEASYRGASPSRPDLNNFNSRRLTQQSSLIAPSEIHVTQNEVHIADRILSTEETLNRLDSEFRSVLQRKQEIVCDMFKVPVEHFQAIADIAGQPEAAKEPGDLLLATFAQIQTLNELLAENICQPRQVNMFREVAAVSNSFCDSCYKAREALNNDRNNVVSSMVSSTSTSEATAIAVRAAPIEDEDGYCEIEEIRNEIMQSTTDGDKTIDTSLHEDSSRITASTISESIKTCKGTCYNHLLVEPPSAVPCNLLAPALNALSVHISQLMPIISQREKERDLLRRENQHLREMLSSINERVIEKEEAPQIPEKPNVTEKTVENTDETPTEVKKDEVLDESSSTNVAAEVASTETTDKPAESDSPKTENVEIQSAEPSPELNEEKQPE